MKISELNNKSFLGAPGAATHSYVLVNYEDNTTNEPVTYKATLEELGKSIASNLRLYKYDTDSDAAGELKVLNGEYVEEKAFALVSDSEVDMIHAAQSESDVERTVHAILDSERHVYYDDGLATTVDGPVPYVLTVDSNTGKAFYYDPESLSGYVDYENVPSGCLPVYAMFESVVQDGKKACKLVTIDNDTEIVLSTFTVDVEDSTVQPSESEY